MPRQLIAISYLACVFYALFFVEHGAFHDGLVLGLGLGGIALAVLAWCAVRDIQFCMQGLHTISAAHEASHQVGLKAIEERDAWQAECERLRKFYGQVTGVTLK